MDEKISAFLTDVIPNEIPKRRRRKLVDELSCHIEDKTDAFREIGYSDEDSVSKALEAFAETDETKKSISNSFDEMYHERTVWAFLAAIGIFLINLASFPLDSWVYSVENNTPPYTRGAACSFAMIFAVLSLIAFARAKRLRKTLIGIAAGIVLTAGVPVKLPIWNVYAQAAIYALIHDPVYFINEYTNAPLVTLNKDAALIAENVLNLVALPLALIIYCITASVRIKRGEAKKTAKRGNLKRYAVFAAVYVCIAAVFSAAASNATGFEKYTGPFDGSIGMTARSERIFDDIADCSSVKECDAVLRDADMITLDEYRASLSRARRKKFDIQFKEYQIPDSLTTYIMLSGKPVWGNGFIFIGSTGDRVTLKGVGSTYAPTADGDITAHLNFPDVGATAEDFTGFFGSLKKGQAENEVLGAAKNRKGNVYAKFIYGEGMKTTAYRLCFRSQISDRTDNAALVNLIFTDGRLTYADMLRQGCRDGEQFDTAEALTLPE